MAGMFGIGGARVVGAEHLPGEGAGVVVTNAVTPVGLRRLMGTLRGRALVWGGGGG